MLNFIQFSSSDNARDIPMGGVWADRDDDEEITAGFAG
jgi:hypothetical protein